MGTILTPKPVKLFVGVLSSIPELMLEAETRLSAVLGPIDLRSEVFPFDSTHYYDEEMGSPIQRRFLAFKHLIDPERLASIKTTTNEMEAASAREYLQVKRPINLDPGYLELAKIVLASTKNFSHRILISHGIYAEVTQQYRSGEWHSFPWTFPDFRNGRYNAFFSSLRSDYRDHLKLLRSLPT